MALPQIVKAPNFPKQLDREKYAESNKSSYENKRYKSTSRAQIKLNIGTIKHRVAFNGNFTGRNSMAKRYRKHLFKSGTQITRDFDPNTVYRGIEDVDFELEELEENRDYLDQGDLDDYQNDLIDEEIDMYMENNKNLLKKVNNCAENVAKGISKAANLKNSKLIVYNKEEGFNGK